VSYSWTRLRCEDLDRSDPLREVRDRFFVPDGVIYLDGNSLGALPKAVPGRVLDVLEREWGTGLTSSWESWMSAPDRVGDKIARLIGARAGEVVVVDTTTIALVKLLGAALGARPGRRVILTTATNFPTDLYAAQGLARLLGDVEVRYAEPDGIAEALDETVAALMLTHVDFRTGAMFDIESLTRAAHGAGALTVWDLCHSVGAVVVECERDGVDLAVGCVYVRRELQELVENPLPGWLGHEAPFDFVTTYQPAAGVRRFVTSSPSILGISALDTALDAWEGVTVQTVREKSMALGELFVEAVFERLGDEFELASPADPHDRGSQVSLRHEHGYPITQALIARGVIGDFRAPDLCRFGFTPLYLRYADVYDAVQVLVDVVTSGEYRAERYSAKRLVT
jgi:kynureninase